MLATGITEKLTVIICIKDAMLDELEVTLFLHKPTLGHLRRSVPLATGKQMYS